MEKNIYDALHDIPTLTELCILILYLQAISHRYMHIICGPNASYSTGTIDGQLWVRPDAVYAIWALAPTLPHLREALIKFFEGASDNWDHFMIKYDPEAEIAQTSALERQRAFVKNGYFY
jgi:hypothetical protein